MTHQSIQARCEKIYSFLAQKQLKNAFDALVQLMYENNMAAFSNRIDELQTTYKYMLQYTVESANDPERQKIYDKLFVDTYRLCDEMQQELLSKKSTQIPYSFVTTQQSENLTDGITALSTIGSQYDMTKLSAEKNIPYDIKMNYQQRLSELFTMFWANHFYTDEFVQKTQTIVKDKTLKDYEISLLTSATTLSIWRNFDSNKFNVLFEIANSESEIVKQRAYVGILISIYIYSERLQYYPSITTRFTILSENKHFIESIKNIIIQFIRSKETEKVARRFNEEIIPKIARLSPEMYDKLNFNKQEADEEDKNPDWQEILDEIPGLTDNMKEISDMQMEGLDVFLSTFAMLKNYPFFNNIYNWLMPFSSDYPEIADMCRSMDNSSIIDIINKSHFLCNSDKYSFILSLQDMPSSQRQQMLASNGADFDNLKEIEKDETSLNKNRTSEYISNQYIQDLYRLFNLHPRKNDFTNIFKKRLDFHNKTAISKLIEDAKIWHNVAEYYFTKNYYNEAEELFDMLLEKEQTNVEMLQKRGYCAQKKGEYDTALKFYFKADLIESNNSWTIKKIANCYRMIGNAEKALSYYKQAIKLQPKNISLQISAGHCQLSLKQYEEALNTYFKIEMNSNSPQKVWRPIAWISFISNKIEQAKRYYSKILDQQPTSHDYVNAGHTELASKNNKTALELYKKAVINFNGDIDKFIEIFEEDKIHLLKYGIAESDLPILLDSLRYSLE